MKNVLERLKDELVDEWDKADEATKVKVVADYEALPNFHDGMREFRAAYEEFEKKWPNGQDQLRLLSSEQIHDENVREASRVIENLVKRVEKKIGTITDYSGVYINPDNEGFATLNGWFKGTEGICEVRSIRAGGYNIQKRHIRVLVK